MLARNFDKFFFEPCDARGLNVFRILFCGGVLLQIVGEWTRFAEYHSIGVYHSIPALAWIGLLPLSVYRIIHLALILALATSALGIFTRASLASACALFFLFIGTSLGFTKSPLHDYVFHSKNIVVPVLLILAVAPGVDFWTLKRWFQKRTAPPVAPMIPQWPVRLIQLAIIAAYFGAGYVRFLTSGWSWADGHTLQGILIYKHLLNESKIGWWLASDTGLCKLLSVGTFAFELSFLAVLFLRRGRWGYILGGIVFHIFILLTMNINFLRYFAISYLIFIEWDIWKQWIGAIRKSTAPIESRDNVEISPTTVLNDYNTQVSFIVATLILLFAPIFLRIESWPLSDYRVFPARYRPDWVEVVRLRAVMNSGEKVWLSDEHVLGAVDVISNRLAQYYNSRNLEQAREYVASLRNILKKNDDRSRIVGLEAVQRTVISSPSKEFRIEEKLLFSVDFVPTGNP